MKQNKVKGYGARGWVLIIWIATAFLAYMVIGSYPLNILSEMYGGQQTVSTTCTVASIVTVIIQLGASGFVGKLKSIKKLGMILGFFSILALLGIMFIPGYIPGTMQKIWLAVYAAGTVLSMLYGTFALSILVGQWFPTRKGSVMGISTFAFPLANGVLGVFAAIAFAGGAPHIPQAFAPFLIIIIIGWIIGVIFVTDYPEEVGAFRDNNPDMTAEAAKAMMLQEIENKKNTVWTLNHTLTTRDFWLITIPAGFLLMFSTGTMSQSNAVLTSAGLGDKLGLVMPMIMIFGLIGSFLFGVLDEKIGTKKAMLIACIIMLFAGICGAVSSAENNTLLIVAMLSLAIFMGASSNFTVSLAAQYWRREDFGTVFSAVNPVANFINALGPMVIGMIMSMTGTYNKIFSVTIAAGVISIIFMFLFSANHVKAKDDEYRAAVGKPLDDALAGRK